VASTSGGIGALAFRYAVAVYELADEVKALDETAADLNLVKSLITEHASLARLVASPLVDRAAKARAMDAIVEHVGAGDLTRRTVGLMARNGRLFALVSVIDAFLAELSRRRGEVSAEVASAVPLNPSQTAAIVDAIKKSVSGSVSINHKIDPDLIGGFVVRVGSRMIDTSLRSKLLRLQLAMKEAC